MKLTQKRHNRPSRLMKQVLCSNGSWIEESSAVLNRSWTHDSYLSLCRTTV